MGYASSIDFEQLLQCIRGLQAPAGEPGVVNFGCCALQSHSIYQIEEALKHSKAVHTLDLTGCQIDDRGAEALARALRVNTELRVLHLKCNSITRVGAASLATVLAEHNCTLTSLDLTGNPCQQDSRDLLAAIDNALHRNKMCQEPMPRSPIFGGVTPGAYSARFTDLGSDGSPLRSVGEETTQARLESLEAAHRHAAEQLERLQGLVLQYDTWKVQVDVASSQLGLVLGVLEQDVSAVKFNLGELLSWRDAADGAAAGVAQQLEGVQQRLEQQQQQQQRRQQEGAETAPPPPAQSGEAGSAADDGSNTAAIQQQQEQQHMAALEAEQELRSALSGLQGRLAEQERAAAEYSAHVGRQLADLRAELAASASSQRQQHQQGTWPARLAQGSGSSIDRAEGQQGEGSGVCSSGGSVASSIRALSSPHSLRNAELNTPYLCIRAERLAGVLVSHPITLHTTPGGSPYDSPLSSPKADDAQQQAWAGVCDGGSAVQPQVPILDPPPAKVLSALAREDFRSTCATTGTGALDQVRHAISCQARQVQHQQQEQDCKIRWLEAELHAIRSMVAAATAAVQGGRGSSEHPSSAAVTAENGGTSRVEGASACAAVAGSSGGQATALAICGSEDGDVLYSGLSGSSRAGSSTGPGLSICDSPAGSCTATSSVSFAAASPAGLHREEEQARAERQGQRSSSSLCEGPAADARCMPGGDSPRLGASLGSSQARAPHGRQQDGSSPPLRPQHQQQDSSSPPLRPQQQHQWPSLPDSGTPARGHVRVDELRASGTSCIPTPRVRVSTDELRSSLSVDDLRASGTSHIPTPRTGPSGASSGRSPTAGMGSTSLSVDELRASGTSRIPTPRAGRSGASSERSPTSGMGSTSCSAARLQLRRADSGIPTPTASSQQSPTAAGGSTSRSAARVQLRRADSGIPTPTAGSAVRGAAKRARGPGGHPGGGRPGAGGEADGMGTPPPQARGAAARMAAGAGNKADGMATPAPQARGAAARKAAAAKQASVKVPPPSSSSPGSSAGSLDGRWSIPAVHSRQRAFLHEVGAATGTTSAGEVCGGDGEVCGGEGEEEGGESLMDMRITPLLQRGAAVDAIDCLDKLAHRMAALRSRLTEEEEREDGGSEGPEHSPVDGSQMRYYN